MQAISNVTMQDVCQQKLPMRHRYNSTSQGWAIKALALYHSKFCEVIQPKTLGSLQHSHLLVCLTAAIICRC